MRRLFKDQRDYLVRSGMQVDETIVNGQRLKLFLCHRTQPDGGESVQAKIEFGIDPTVFIFSACQQYIGASCAALGC